MRLFSDRGKRTKWEAGLSWFRLRYLDPPTRAINLLSRPEACGRVALYYRPGDPVSQLFMGIPRSHTRLVERMAADFGFSLSPKPAAVAIPTAQPMTAVTDLLWNTAFVAHITNEFAFVSPENGGGPYLPQPPSTQAGRGPATWHLPTNPPTGLTTRTGWQPQRPPVHLVASRPDPHRWGLGYSWAGVPLHISGRINIYGRQASAAAWLAHLVEQAVLLDPANLVVIDGAGDLVPRLKRKAAVTKLLGKELVYVDMDGPALAGGFNPLAAAPGETETALVGRWQRWFEGMNVQGIQLLAQARQDGVEDIPALRKWLKQAARASSLSRSDVSNLDMTLNRLTVGLREWLEWPANRFEILPGGALFFACKGTGWARQQLLRAALLGAMQVEGVRLVVHGFPVDLNGQAQIVTSNGPLLPHSVKILTGSDPAAAAKLAAVFSNGNPLLAETLEILPSDQAILVDQGDIRLISWSKRGEL